MQITEKIEKIMMIILLAVLIAMGIVFITRKEEDKRMQQRYDATAAVRAEYRGR